MATWIGRWPGGRIAQDRRGQKLFHLDLMRKGVRYSRKLEATSEQEALAELALFERDPQGYLTHAEAQEKAETELVEMTAALVLRFLQHLKAEGRTERYIKNVQHYLADWARVLAGRDLRRVSLQELKQALVKMKTAKKHRIISIKSFFAFLRETDAVLTRTEDPTLDLKVPPARPEKAKREKAYTMKELAEHYAAISGWTSPKLGGQKTDVQAVRDLVVVHAKTGLHGSEIQRIAQGKGELTVLGLDSPHIRGVVRVVHKSGRVHVQSLDAQALAALQRLQARGDVPADSWVRKVLKKAATILKKTEPIKLGRLRHSFVTWAKSDGELVRPTENGIPLDTIANIIGHSSMSTTSRFYDDTRVMPMVRLPLRLHHPEDPLLLVLRAEQDDRVQRKVP